MSQGEAAEESYVILSGRVSVSAVLDGERVPLRDCGVGEIVGEMALVSHEPRSATVQALEETVVAVVTKQGLQEQLDGLPPHMAGMISTLVARLRDQSVSHRSDW
jgi:CRP-like cAMP-binding protein